MNTTNLERLTEFFGARGITAALLSNPWTVAWLTGYAPPIQTGPSPFDGGPALGWWAGGDLTLIASDAEAGAARATGAEVWEYAGYTIDEPLDVVERQAAVLREVLGGWDGRGADVAVELRFLPAALAGIVHEALPGAALRPVDGQLEPLRAVKTPEEIVKLRAALALCDQSQADVRMLLQPGVSEISLWGELKAGLEVRAGGRLPVLADLVAGVRTGEMGGLPGPYVLQEGDPVIADIVPRLDGYWGDICGTYFVGAPPAEMAKIRGIVHDALRRGIDAVRPGRDCRGTSTPCCARRSGQPGTNRTRTTPDTASGSASTRSRASCRTTTWRWLRIWSSPSSRAFTCRGSAACGWRTWCW